MVKKYAYDHGYNKQKSRGYQCVSTTVLYRKKMKTNVIIVVMKKIRSLSTSQQTKDETAHVRVDDARLQIHHKHTRKSF